MCTCEHVIACVCVYVKQSFGCIHGTWLSQSGAEMPSKDSGGEGLVPNAAVFRDALCPEGSDFINGLTLQRAVESQWKLEWNLVEESGSLFPATSPGACSPSLYPAAMSTVSLFHHVLPAILFYLNASPLGRDQASRIWEPWNRELKCTFPPLSWLVPYGTSNRKLTESFIACNQHLTEMELWW